MPTSPEADQILAQIRALRENRARCLERDMHFIDASYDRQIRKVHASHYLLGPFCLRRFCLRGVVSVRRRISHRR